MGERMNWQIVMGAAIVGAAVVSLYRHLRALVGSSAPDAPASCHGCEDCETETPALSPPGSTTLQSQSPRLR